MSVIIRSSNDGDLSSLHGRLYLTVGEAILAIARLSRWDLVTVEWPNGETAVYRSQEDADRDSDGSRARAVIEAA